MSASILLGYATTYGSTREVAEVIAATLRESGLTIDVQPLREVKSLEGYSAVVVGAPIYMFRWHKDALRFLSHHRKTLLDRPVAIFALGPTHDPHDDQEWRDSWSQLEKALAQFPWLKPVALEMFGGKYDPENLRFPLKMLAGGAPATDIRDWTAIRSWARDLVAYLPGMIYHQ